MPAIVSIFWWLYHLAACNPSFSSAVQRQAPTTGSASSLKWWMECQAWQCSVVLQVTPSLLVSEAGLVTKRPQAVQPIGPPMGSSKLTHDTTSSDAGDASTASVADAHMSHNDWQLSPRDAQVSHGEDMSGKPQHDDIRSTSSATENSDAACLSLSPLQMVWCRVICAMQCSAVVVCLLLLNAASSEVTACAANSKELLAMISVVHCPACASSASKMCCQSQACFSPLSMSLLFSGLWPCLFTSCQPRGLLHERPYPASALPCSSHTYKHLRQPHPPLLYPSRGPHPLTPAAG